MDKLCSLQIMSFSKNELAALGFLKAIERRFRPIRLMPSSIIFFKLFLNKKLPNFIGWRVEPELGKLSFKLTCTIYGPASDSEYWFLYKVGFCVLLIDGCEFIGGVALFISFISVSGIFLKFIFCFGLIDLFLILLTAECCFVFILPLRLDTTLKVSKSACWLLIKLSACSSVKRGFEDGGGSGSGGGSVSILRELLQFNKYVQKLTKLYFCTLILINYNILQLYFTVLLIIYTINRYYEKILTALFNFPPKSRNWCRSFSFFCHS